MKNKELEKNNDYHSIYTQAIIEAKENIIKSPKSPYNKKKIWDLNLTNRIKIKLLPEKLKNDCFLKMIENGEFYGRIFSLKIINRGKYMINAKEIEKNENLEFYKQIYDQKIEIDQSKKEIEKSVKECFENNINFFIKKINDGASNK